MRHTWPSKRFCAGLRLFLGLILLLGAVSAIASQEAPSSKARGSSYQLSSFSVDGGGGDSSSANGRARLSVTVGQPDARTLRGGNYELDGGIWEVSAAIAVTSLSLLGCFLLLTGMVVPGAFRLRRMRVVAAAAVLGLLAFAERSSAEPLSTSFTVQGRLVQDGAPVNDTLSMTFKLYDSAAGPTSLGTVELPAVQVSDGGFNATLDFGDGAFEGEKRWLGISIGDDPEMTPRQALTAAPYALYALGSVNAQSLGGNGASAFALATHQHSANDINSGTLADARIPAAIARDSEILPAVLGADGADSGLDADLLDGLNSTQFLRTDTDGTIAGSLTIDSQTGVSGLEATGPDFGVRGVTSNPVGSAVYGQALSTSGGSNGVFGLSQSSAGTGVLGYVSAASGVNFGVRGQTDSTQGFGALGDATSTSGVSVGVQGQTSSSSGKGVVGYAAATSGSTTGVYGHTVSTSGIAVDGYAQPATGTTFGVRGTSSSTAGTGVQGVASAATGSTIGVEGRSVSGTGVAGTSTASSGITYGVYGTSASTNGHALHGHASALTGVATGVWGDSTSTSGTGIYGTATASTGPTTGVHGRSSSSSGTGVTGVATSTTGSTLGVYGQNFSSSGIGVSGEAATLTGTNYGVKGLTQSSAGYGVYGTHNSTSGTTAGVYGSTLSSAADATAVHGAIGVVPGSGATAVRGEISNTGSNGAGVLGTHAGSGAGVIGRSVNGNGVRAESTGSGTALVANSSGGDIIQGYGDVVGNARFRVSNDGHVTADNGFSGPAADFAELLPADAGLEPGDLLSIGPDGKLALSSRSYQTAVAGIYSTQPGFLGGAGDEADPSGKVPLAIVGIVPVKAVAENGGIRPGDLLVASSTPGHAMKGGVDPPNGTVVGKALSSLDGGEGTIQMLVTLQ